MEIYIIGASRTPLGSFLGGLSQIPATDLGGIAIKAALNQANVSPEKVDCVYFGNVLSAGLGQNPGKQASLASGIPSTVPCTTINKVCCSSLKAIVLAAQDILLENATIAVAAGAENMSLAPHLLPKSRTGQKMGDFQVVDSMIKDGLWDAKYDLHMGALVDKLAVQKGITREDQDRFSIQSFSRARAATEIGAHKLTPVKFGRFECTKDETIEKLIIEKVPKLRPCFVTDETGTITPANSSAISDGAAAIILASGAVVKELGLKPIAKLLSWADAGVDPADFPLAPVFASKKALEKVKMDKSQIDLWEINEAFAAVPLLFEKEMELSEDRINVLGGAVALGHPLGCTGCRIVNTLLSALETKQKKFGLATLCNGGGGATALIIEMI